MSDSIQISIDKVKDIAGTIRNCNRELTDRISEISNQMNGLVDTWQSEAATTILAKFNDLKPSFEDYEKVIEAYAEFLVQTADSYDETETAINNNASQFN